ncbi:hypothetical protein HPB50_005122 [Hyalomma asiaticum]|uniref:Uncharacterized protein n=1 Tax=Hyalomma asiaticum TaxID=266040 RepID=A0ACB7TFF2_HYAAI|nr:hypothetical protein HPB50_005122 [Hyalomma asiaticum]
MQPILSRSSFCADAAVFGSGLWPTELGPGLRTRENELAIVVIAQPRIFSRGASATGTVRRSPLGDFWRDVCPLRRRGARSGDLRDVRRRRQHARTPLEDTFTEVDCLETELLSVPAIRRSAAAKTMTRSQPGGQEEASLRESTCSRPLGHQGPPAPQLDADEGVEEEEEEEEEEEPAPA